MTWLLIRYGEVWLKGKKRSFFERKLVQNIKKCLDAGGHLYQQIIRKPGRILIETPVVYAPLARLPGIVSFSFAYKTEPTIEKITEEVKKFLPFKGESFCIRAKRLEKIGQCSQEWERALGSYIVHETGKRVDLGHPDIVFGIELFQDAAFLFFESLDGCGGLPQIKEGRIILLLQTERDLLAGKLLLKRGCVPEVYSSTEALCTALIASCPGISLQRVSSVVPSDFVAAGDRMENYPYPILLPLEGLTEEEIVQLGGR